MACAVEVHLKWLEARQDATTGAIGTIEDTSLALLAFLGAGYTDRGSQKENPFARCVRSSLRFLLTSQGQDGSLADRSRDGWLRSHAIATLALAEAFRLTRNPRYKKPAQDGLDLLARIRVAGGGWNEDVATTAWALSALRIGQLAGLSIDPDTLAGARLLIEKRKSALAPADQAVALLVRILLGEDPHGSADCKALADSLLTHLPDWRDGAAPPLDLWYFGTMAMFQMGGTHWKQWNEAMVAAIVERQRGKDAGALAGTWPIDGATIGDQAKLATCLEVYYRYDRIFGVR